MSERGLEIWQKILDILDEKLQYGFLEQAKRVTGVRLEGNSLHLTVGSEEALQFFSSSVNQQRLIIISRPMISLAHVLVEIAPPQAETQANPESKTE